MKRCHGHSIAEVAREYALPYTTVECWFYLYVLDLLAEERTKHVCLDQFALRKVYNYTICTLNAETGRILAIVDTTIHLSQTALWKTQIIK
ncbi:hypothetical protein [Solibacillus sp. FSL K6-1523]|uniref:hypothetical protein n=1 Tax=Solibacillus sp. FSL K6-1523 TaxID=2921471 RepID=UPI0030FCCDA4